MAKKEALFVYDCREPVLLSWMRDAFTFGALCFSAWFINTQMPPSGWLNFTLSVLFIIWMINRSLAKRMSKSPDEARQWINENYPG